MSNRHMKINPVYLFNLVSFASSEFLQLPYHQPLHNYCYISQLKNKWLVNIEKFFADFISG